MEEGKRGGCPLGGWAAGQLLRRALERRAVRHFEKGLVLLLALSLACAGPRQNVDPTPSQNADGFSLILNSHHLLDVNIFVHHEGQADRVALVPAASSKLVVLPLWMLGQSKAIRIIVEPIGEDSRYTTDVLSVQPGQVIELNVESLLARSNYSIQ